MIHITSAGITGSCGSGSISTFKINGETEINGNLKVNGEIMSCKSKNYLIEYRLAIIDLEGGNILEDITDTMISNINVRTDPSVNKEKALLKNASILAAFSDYEHIKIHYQELNSWELVSVE